ncbi:MAG: anaerobic ribonucleoside-triphosphate reductase activating protein [Dysgonamonadaceae bacterium]|jgi:anaerobic ribonucleoside-triphosphate reductase activating protein|nr:anaerobic ribonucleoside-triphosphate reductase activating protein [Dysgonamonadaceae bacterium]
MLSYVSYDIVFQEIPGEVTLAINISNCPNNCKGCHSPYLQEDTGEILNETVLAELLESYGNAVTCICFMGGDAEPDEVERLAVFVRTYSGGKIKTGWYSGCDIFPVNISHFDFVKLGSYVENLGGLDAPTTNQRFYSIENGTVTDMTELFFRTGKET